MGEGKLLMDRIVAQISNLLYRRFPNLRLPEVGHAVSAGQSQRAPRKGATTSQVSNLRTSEKARGMGIPPVCRREVGDTANGEPALRSAESSEIDAALADPAAANWLLASVPHLLVTIMTIAAGG